MLTKIIYLFILIPQFGFTLTRFPQATCRLEGFLVKATNETNWYFIVNHRTNSETRFRLNSFAPSSEMNEKGQFVQALLEIPHETFSLYGEAGLKKLEHYINPYVDVKHYSLEAELRRACNSDRYPNSIHKFEKKK